MKRPGQNDIVLSLAGHDEGKLFLVVAAEGERILLCDGKNRRLVNPKCKSPKHVRLVERLEQSPLTDKEIRTTLALAAKRYAAAKEEEHHGER